MVREYKDITPVQIPKIWEKSLIVKAEPGTRWYIERNDLTRFDLWLREIHTSRAGLCIPLQWVPDYVGVSRSAVHQRAKRGGLTVFSFIAIETTRGILGGERENERQRYDLVPVTECDEWKELLYDRCGAIQEVTGRDASLEEAENVESIIDERKKRTGRR